ncbi:MAG: cytochrome c biogenesis protein ResB [Deltaproteobacteria bacterium]|nr:cytochrome c biogenesis protein ResB [Deltaproteobacteria bacterium]
MYKYLSSIKLTLLLTYLIVAVTMTGSFALLFHREDFDTIDSYVLINWISRNSPALSWWIILLIALVFIFSINTILCTYERLAALVKAWRGKQIEAADDEETRVSEDIEKERGLRLRAFLPYIAHIGFLIALAGHLAGSLWGFRGAEIPVKKGEIYKIKEAPGLLLKLNDATMEIGRRGYPEEMWATVDLLSGKKILKKHKVEINSPLVYRDIAVYIKNVQSYTKGIILNSSDGERTFSFLLAPGKDAYLGAGGLTVTAGKIDERYGAMEILLFKDMKLVARKWLTPYNPSYKTLSYDGMTLSAGKLSISKTAVLTVNKDPGAKIVFWGLLLFAVSLLAHLFYRRSK